MTQNTIDRGIAQALFMALLLVAIALFPGDAHAIDNTMVLKEQVEGLEKLLTSGYMRLGLLGICGITAILWALSSKTSGCLCPGCWPVFLPSL